MNFTALTRKLMSGVGGVLGKLVFLKNASPLGLAATLETIVKAIQ